MKKLTLVPAMACAALVLAGCNSEPAEDKKDKSSELETMDQKFSYVFGYNLGTNAASEDMNIDVDALTQGLSAALAGEDSRFTQEEEQAIVSTFQAEMRAKMEEKQQALAAEKKAESEAFLEENKSKEGVTVLDSGLQYKVLEEGDGASPSADDNVLVHYKGTLLDGTQFDSSYSRGEPVEFPVARMIPGWVEILPLMEEGDKWEVYVPSDLAYGPGGAPSRGGSPGIPPNSALIFEMKLIEVIEAEETEQAKGEAAE